MHNYLQLDILRGIHADLSALAQEVNHLLGFQIVVHLVTAIINVIMFAYFFIAATIDGHFYWPYLVLCLLPAIKIFLIGHWGQTLEQQVIHSLIYFKFVDCFRYQKYTFILHINENIWNFTVKAAFHDNLSDINCRWFASIRTSSSKTYHPNAPPMPYSHRCRLLYIGTKYDTEGNIASPIVSSNNILRNQKWFPIILRMITRNHLPKHCISNFRLLVWQLPFHSLW